MTDWIATPEPGIYPDVPAETYYRWDAMSQSQVKPFAKSAQHYLDYRQRGIDSEAIRLGALTDTLLFEAKEFSRRFIIRPAAYESAKGVIKPWNANATVCKEMLKQYEASGLVLVAPAQHQEAAALVEAVKKHPDARVKLSRGQPQVSIVWDDDESGVRCKGRLDWLTKDRIVDLKTTRDASKEGWPIECRKYGYHIQGAMYLDGYAALTGRQLAFAMIAVEKRPKPLVAVYRFGDDSIAAGRKVYKRVLFSFRQCKASDVWPGYSSFEERIEIPAWALREELGEEIADVGF